MLARGLRFRSLLYGALLAPMAATTVPSQPPPRDGYLSRVPPAGRIVGQAAASARLHVYGDRADPAYRDVAPTDGVDDVRALRLRQLAEHFSPLLRRNNYSVPRDFVEELGARPLLHADLWREGRLVRSQALELRIDSSEAQVGAGVHGDGRLDGAALAPPSAGAAVDDALLDSLLRALHPRRPSAGVRPPEGESETVLFFDFPGHDEHSWRAAYRDRRVARTEARSAHGSRTYAHFFVHEDAAAERPERFALVVQYWFFYPFNDGPNNHEGDWEHINVVVTTRARAAASPPADGRLTEAEVLRALEARDGTPLDSLVIAFVDYYFHHNVVTVRYLDAGAPAAAPQNRVWQDANFIPTVVRRRRELAGGRLASHPVGYIGGNNMGPDELLRLRPRFRGSFGRNSHGTYPFPAVWRTIGALDATEKVFGDVVPRLRTDATGGADSLLPWHALVDDPYFVVYTAADIVLLPDWERLEDLVLEEPDVRRRWAWLLLPIRFGFPTAASPGAGAVRRTDLGNVAPLGPAFHAGWNRMGPTAEHHAFDPTVIRIAFAPVTPWTSLQNGWGVLNAPFAALGLMPGYNVALTQLLPWATGVMHVLGAPPAKTIYPGELPLRVTSFGAGGYYQLGGNDFARLLPQREDAVLADFLAAHPGAFIDAESYERGNEPGLRLSGTLHYGNRFAVENTFSTDTTDVRYTVRAADGGTLGAVRGRLSVKELTGAFVYRPFVTRRLPANVSVRAGYAWTWYTLRDVRLGGAAIGADEVKGGYAPTILPSKRWWPNSWHAGASVEVFAPKRLWLFERLGYGLRADGGVLLHQLASRAPCGARCDVTVQRVDGALSLVFGW